MRVKNFRISWELLRELFTEGEHKSHYSVIGDAIPADAELVNVRHCWDIPHMIEIQIRSSSFPELPSGCMVESITPIMSRNAVDAQPTA